MSYKDKKNKEYKFAPWINDTPDGKEGRFFQLGNSFLLHPTTQSLSDKAYKVYTYMLLDAGGKREFIYPRSKYIKVSSVSAFQNARNELIKKGYIRVKEHNWTTRKPDVYEFVDDWKRYKPP